VYNVSTMANAGLIEYLDEKFGAIQAELGELRGSFDTLQTSVDAYAKKADTYFQEMAALSHRLERHERWLQQLAEKVGVRLES
jgi:prefoldin subunit 5